jgi:hypothetical protein
MVEATWDWQKNKNRLRVLEQFVRSSVRVSKALVLPSIRDHQCSFESFASALCCFGLPQGCYTPMPAQTIGCVYLESFCLVWRILLGVGISCFVQTHSLPVRPSLRNRNSVLKTTY